MNVIVLLAATAITTTFLSSAPVNAAQGKQIYASAGSGEDVSARRRKSQYSPRYYHQKREIFPQACNAVIFPRSPVCGPPPFTLSVSLFLLGSSSDSTMSRECPPGLAELRFVARQASADQPPPPGPVAQCRRSAAMSRSMARNDSAPPAGASAGSIRSDGFNRTIVYPRTGIA